MNKTVISLSICMLLASCATPYQKEGFGGGYTIIAIDEKVFQVSFRGNGYTFRQKEYDYALLAAADTSLKYDCSYFVAVNNARQGFSIYADDVSEGLVKTNNNAYAYKTKGGQLYEIVKLGTKNTYVCFSEKPNAALPGLIFNARIVAQSIREQYGIN